MKKLDRLTTVFSIFLAKFLIVFGVLFYMNADDFVIYFISIIGLLLIIFYLSFEVVLEELSAIGNHRKKQTKKQDIEQENLVAFRRLFGGEENEK